MSKLDVGQEPESTYDLMVIDHGVEEPYRTGLSHAAALRLAHYLERDGLEVRVMLRVEPGSHVVDPYPLRR